MMDTRNSNGSSRARSRIADVLADARASLIEPSRPFTPASLDQRTSLSNIKSLDKHSRIALTRSSMSQGSLLRNSYEIPKARIHDGIDLSNKRSNEGKERERESASEVKKSVSHQNSAENSEVLKLRTVVRNTAEDDVLTNVRYLKLIIPPISPDGSPYYENSDNEDLKMCDVISLKEFCIDSYDSVENISKYLVSEESRNLKVVMEIIIAIEGMFYYVTYNDKIGNENENEFTRKLACRLIIRLSLAVIRKLDLFNDFSDADKMNTKLKFIIEVFSATIKTMFRFLKIFIESNSLNNTSIFIENSAALSDLNNKHLMIPNVDINEFDLSSYGNLSDLLNDFIFQNSFDLLLEFQNMMSTLLPNLGLNVIDSIGKINENKRNQNNNNDNDESDNDNNERNENKTSNKMNKKSKYDEKENQFFTVLEISIFIAGILRHHSCDELNRKKSYSLNLMGNITEELKSIGSFTVECQKMIIFNIEKTKNNIIDLSTGFSMDVLLNKIVEKLSQCVVQLVVVIRNFSLDINGKTQLLNTKMIGLLCSLLKPFKKFPELILNCVRVTAKLSLQDNFRAQINSKSAQIKCLIEVLVYEGIYCRNIMNGEGYKNDVKSNFCDIFNVKNGKNSSRNNFRDISEKEKFKKYANEEKENFERKDKNSDDSDFSENKNNGNRFAKNRIYGKKDPSRKKENSEENKNDRYSEKNKSDAKYRNDYDKDKEKEYVEDEDEEEDEESSDDDDDDDDDEKEDDACWPFWYTWPLISRITFTLGNLTTSNSNNRVKIGLECKSLLPILSLLQACAGSLYQIYATKKEMQNSEKCDTDKKNALKDSSDDDDDDGDDDSNTAVEQELSDATVKLLRLLANLSIEQSIGEQLAATPDTIQMLTDLVACSSRAHIEIVSTDTAHTVRDLEFTSPGSPEDEELLLNAVAACTNITFYACKEENVFADIPDKNKSENNSKNKERTDSTPSSPNRRERQLVSLSKQLANCLFHQNEEIVLESVRALGNLSRSKEVTRSLLQTRSDEALLLLLSHPSKEIVKAVSGALVNLSGDVGWRSSYFARSSGGEPSKSSPFPPLLQVLRRSALKDLGLSILVCQVLHNLLQLEGNKEKSLKNNDSSKNKSTENSVGNILLIHRLPQLLISTLDELIDCSDDMSETLKSLLVTDRRTDNTKNSNNDNKNSKNIHFDKTNHIFTMPEFRNTNESIKKYLDFSKIARSVLENIKNHEKS